MSSPSILKGSIGVDSGESDESRAASRGALQTALQAYGSGTDFAAAARTLARTPSRLVMVALEDVLGVADQINLPGTVRQYPNWRKRLPLPVEKLGNDPGLRRIADVFAQAGRASST